jgi:hypothetical protein
VRPAELLTKLQVEEEIPESRQATAPSFAGTNANGSHRRHELAVLGHQYELDTESLDMLDEDLHANNRASATGLLGKTSGVQWLRAAALARPERADEGPRTFYRGSSYRPDSAMSKLARTASGPIVRAWTLTSSLIPTICLHRTSPRDYSVTI